jgi:Uma2 family endonuclease
MVASLKITPVVGIEPRIKKMAIERFRDWRPRDGWKYDWNDGITTKYKRMISEKQRYIVRNLLRAFHLTETYKQGHDILPESETSYDNTRYRIPDIAYYTHQQTNAAAKGEHTVSDFVIEILSDSDLQKSIENKLWEYFEEGVKVVWHIIPYRQIVKVYTSPRHVSICLGDDMCSAKPVLNDFEIPVNQIFEIKE